MLYEAVRGEWQDAQRLAESRLGDVSLAQQLMEQAIGDTKEHLETMPAVDVDEARRLLARYYKNAVQRWSRSQNRFVFRGTASDIETLSEPTPPQAQAVEAKLDLKSILDDTPPELRRALLLRYGARSRWEDVAKETSKSADAVRMSCEREIKRIRKKLGIRGRSG